MSSLQEAICRPDTREAYVNRFPNVPRAIVQRFIEQFSHALQTRMVETSSSFLAAAMMGNEPAFDEMSVNPEIDEILRELFVLTREAITSIYEANPENMQQGRGWGIPSIPSWAWVLRTDFHKLLSVISPANNVTMIVDRELYNSESVIDYANANPDRLQVKGVITPFHEVDDRLVKLIDRMQDLREFGECMPLHDPETGIVDFFATGPCTDQVLVLHAAYDAKSIKLDPAERKRYCEEELLPRILETNPKIVFLSNFKLILDECVPRVLHQHGIKIVNVHPSLLPENKGWRTEKMTLEDINPHASGCTFHYVTPELDGGATLFTMPHPIVQHSDADSIKEMEHLQRLLIIRAQSRFTPKILDWAVSHPQKIVSGDEAFACEGRKRLEGFEEEYHRVLFQVGDGWETLEEIIGKPNVQTSEQIGPLKRYRFYFPCSHEQQLECTKRISDAAYEDPRAKVIFMQQPGGFQAEIETCALDFESAIPDNAERKVIDELTVQVTAKRKPVPL